MAPAAVDAAVAALLGVWWVIGAGTVDDGYIAGIVRGRGDNGFVGNVYRWLNAPEAPFSWFYDGRTLVVAGLGRDAVDAPAVDAARAAVLAPGVAAAAAPLGRAGRLGAHAVAGRARVRHLVGAAEPGAAARAMGRGRAVLACWPVERAVATRRLLPLGRGLWSRARRRRVTPGGLIAFVPFLAAAVPPAARAPCAPARTCTGGRWAAAAGRGAAAPRPCCSWSHDQSARRACRRPSGCACADRRRAPWYEESERYYAAAGPEGFQGAIGRRAAVLVTLLAAAAVLARGAHEARKRPDGR